MLPNEYEPLKLTTRQQEVHRRYTAMGFKICPRPFAGKGDHLWFFMSLPTEENPRGVEFTINLGNGIAHRTGTQTTYEIEAAEKEFGPKSEAVAAVTEVVPVMESAPSRVKEDHAKPTAREEKSVAARPVVEKPSAPVKKKQTALF